jgi:tRNA(fMet)-specific endonuclease VapC
MLDTNLLVGCLRKKSSIIESVKRNGRGNDLAISSITYGELMVGIIKNDTPRRRCALAKVLAPVKILDFDKDAAQTFAKVKASLETKGTVIGPYDMQIAAHAMSRGYTVVTHNTDEFNRIEGLNVVDWEDE